MSESLFACLYQPPLPGQPSELRPRTSDLGLPTSDLQPPTSNLLKIAAEFSPRYEQHRADLVSIDVRGLSRLLGSPKAIGAEMRREAAARGVRVHVAIAPTRMAALVLALARPGLTVVAAAAVADALASIPLSVLEQLHEEPQPGASVTQARLRADEAQTAIAALKRWGLKTLGELAVLPAADLSARLGRGGRVWQAIARGEDTRPLVPMQPEERFEGRIELEWPIEAAEPLSFVLTRLLEPLSTRLERRDRGAAVLHVQLGLVTREVHACRLELPTPLRDVRALRTLALLDFESRQPGAAIDSVAVIIEPTPGRILQHALFTRPHPTPEQLSTLLARLGALMGQDRIGAPALVDSYRPGAFAMTPFAVNQNPQSSVASHQTAVDGAGSLPSDLRPQTSELQPPTSALRRCRQPVPARVATDTRHRPLRVSSDRRGFAGGAVLSCAGPWRTSGAWWEEQGTQHSEVRTQKSELRSLTMNEKGRGQRSEGGGQRSEPVVRSREDSGLASPKREQITREGGPWSRDEWDVAVADGTVYRIFRDRATDGWFIDGVID
jgi:protein ImuB